MSSPQNDDPPPLHRRQFLATTAAAAAATGMGPLASGAEALAPKALASLPEAFVILRKAMFTLKNIVDSGDSIDLLQSEFMAKWAEPPVFPIFTTKAFKTKAEYSGAIDRYCEAEENYWADSARTLRKLLETDPQALVRQFAEGIRTRHYDATEKILALQPQVKEAAKALNFDLRSYFQKRDAMRINSLEQKVAGLFPPDVPEGERFLSFPGNQSPQSFFDASTANPVKIAQYWVRQEQELVYKEMPELLTKTGMSMDDAKALVNHYRQDFDKVIREERERFMEKHGRGKPIDAPAYVSDDASLMRVLRGEEEWVTRERNKTIDYIPAKGR